MTAKSTKKGRKVKAFIWLRPGSVFIHKNGNQKRNNPRIERKNFVNGHATLRSIKWMAAEAAAAAIHWLNYDDYCLKAGV